MDKKGLYLHIPFCVKKCFYCDFPSFAEKEEGITRYVKALLEEIKQRGALAKGDEFSSVFLGGGTPTILASESLSQILGMVFDKFNISQDAEITIEANPGTLSKEILSSLAKAGVNRLSIGLQAWQDSLLKGLGRIHTRQVFVENFHRAREAGFDNINIDLMFSIPNQTLQNWEETLEQVIQLHPEHISAYSLIVEPNTPFWDKYDKGELRIPEEDEDRQMYHVGREMLQKAGYQQYEISNFSLPYKECSHNIIYWQDEQYMGLGLGAHSYWNGERFHNPYSMQDYMDGVFGKIPLFQEKEKLTIPQQQAEFMFMGLRMTKGIEKARFFRRFQCSIEESYTKEIEALKKDGLLIDTEDFLALSVKGMDLANYVFEKFISY